MHKAAIILPTYNEGKNISNVIRQIFEVTEKIATWEIHVVVVDSSSPDNTAEVTQELMKQFPKLHLLETKKEGLGKAYLDGFRHTIDILKPAVMFEMDADLSHDPGDIPRFLKKIEEGADFVVGSRYIPGGAIPENWGLHRKIFSILGNLIVRIGFMKFSVTEWTNGYRAIKTWVIQKHLDDLKGYTGYVFQIAFLDYALKSGAKTTEIPVIFKDRTQGISKIDSIEYITQTLWYVFTASSFIKFAIVGAVGFVIDFGISFILIDKLKIAVWLSTISSAETAIISNFFMNNFWSFKHKRLNSKIGTLLWSFLKFNLVSSGSVAIQTVGMSLLTAIFGLTYWYVYKFFIIVCVIIPYSYVLYNRFIWKEKQ